jgi:methylmalonyl-CoA mutase N-terminal domain/subunit
MQKIDAMGGSVSAIEQGFMQDEIARSAYAYQRAIEENEKIIVGVNKFQSEETHDTPVFKVDDSIRKIQSDKLASLRARRDQAKTSACLEAIRQAAINNTNLMPPVIDAVENYCTLGEISDVLRGEFGEYR